MKHLGRHLEEIALFVVPQPDEDQVDSDDIGSNAVHAGQGEDSATISTLSSFDSKRPSVAPTQSPNNPGNLHEESDRGLCPACGRGFRDLKAHMLTHQNDRPEKCPVISCEYHTKGFVHTYDRRKHTLTHYKGTMMCGFCPSSVPPAEKSFYRVDVFKRHLINSHGVEQIRPSARRRAKSESLSDDIVHTGVGDGSKCSNCGNEFSSAQEFYEHLDDCILSIIQDQLHTAPSTASPIEHNLYTTDEIPKEEDHATLQSGASLTAPSLAKPDSISNAYSDDVRTQSSAPSPRLKEALQSVLEDSEPIMTGGPHEDDMKAGFTNSSSKKCSKRAARPGRCHSCGRSETPEWRRGPDGARTLCNVCGLNYAKLTRKQRLAAMSQNRHQDGSLDAVKPQDPISPNFDTTATKAQPANAMFSPNLGDTVVPASINYEGSSSSRLDLQLETSGSSDLTMRAISNGEESFRSPPGLGGLTPQQLAVLARQRDLRQVGGHQQNLGLSGTITPKHEVLEFHNVAPPADVQRALQQPQSQPLTMPQWPSMLNSQSREVFGPYLSQPPRPASSDLADEPIPAPHVPLDYQMQTQLLERQNQKRQQMARQEHEYTTSQPVWLSNKFGGLAEMASFRQQANNDTHAVSDGSINNFTLQSRSRSFFDEKDEPQQTHGHPVSSLRYFQISPHGNTATAGALPHSNAQVEIEYLPNAPSEAEASMPQNSERFENARLEDTKLPWPSLPGETLAPFENISDAQPPNAWQLDDSRPDSPSLSSPQAERLPSIYRLLNDNDGLKSEARLSDTTLAGSANAYDKQVLSQMTAVDTSR